MIVGGKVSEVESSMDACASDTRASGGDCVDRFSKVLKCSCHLAATDALSDSSFPSSAFNGADEVAHFLLQLPKGIFDVATYKIILTRARYLLHSLFSDLLRGPARRLYSSTSPLRIACLR